MTKKECKCESIVGEKRFSDNPLGSKFEMIATTSPENLEDLENESSTNILKCINCNSYYLIYHHGLNSPDGKEITIKKYAPTISERGLEKIFRQFNGIVSEEKIEEYSRYISMMEKKEEQRNELKTEYSKN